MKIDQIGICTRDHDTPRQQHVHPPRLRAARHTQGEIPSRYSILSQVDPIVSSKCGILSLLQVPRWLCHPDSIRGIHNRFHHLQSQLTSRCKRRERVLWCPSSKQVLIFRRYNLCREDSNRQSGGKSLHGNHADDQTEGYKQFIAIGVATSVTSFERAKI